MKMFISLCSSVNLVCCLVSLVVSSQSLSPMVFTQTLLDALDLINPTYLWLGQSVEASRLQSIIKDKERAQEANQRIQDMNESFSKETEKKLQERMDAMQEKKNAQIKALLDRLNTHVSRPSRLCLSFRTDFLERLV